MSGEHYDLSGSGRHTCCECGGRRLRDCTPTVKHVDGTIDWVCEPCWRKFGYEEWFAPRVIDPASLNDRRIS